MTRNSIKRIEKMLTLKDILTVCQPDWILVCGKTICTRQSIPEGLLDFPVKEITGWDDGLTVELNARIRPCTASDLIHQERTDKK
jgi:hypothetical protein